MSLADEVRERLLSVVREKRFVKWREYSVVTDTGYEYFHVCPICDAVVEYKDSHLNWHAELLGEEL